MDSNEIVFSKGFWVMDELIAPKTHCKPQITTGLYDQEGKERESGFTIEWDTLSNKKLCAKVRVYQDSWSMFFVMSDIFVALAEIEDTYPSQNKIIALLESLGYKNYTQDILKNCSF